MFLHAHQSRTTRSPGASASRCSSSIFPQRKYSFTGHLCCVVCASSRRIRRKKSDLITVSRESAPADLEAAGVERSVQAWGAALALSACACLSTLQATSRTSEGQSLLHGCYRMASPFRARARGGRAYARNLRLRRSQASLPPAAPLPAPPSETVHQASLGLDAQFPWLAGACARRPTLRAR
jgi:hypothetical protein